MANTAAGPLMAAQQDLVLANLKLAYWAARPLAAWFGSVERDEVEGLCLLALCESVSTWDPSRGPLAPWLFRRAYALVGNRARGQRRDGRARARYRQGCRAEQAAGQVRLDPARILARRDEARRLQELAVRAASPRQRAVLEGLLAGKPAGQVARELNLLCRTVTYHLRDLGRRLRAALGRTG
jgi:DNA-directed RNA polymerase specialized sigma24 family protein